MAETTGISWAHSTFNPWIGCTKVGPGCDHCYAERDMAVRRKVVTWGPGAARKRTSEAYWRQPMKWNRKAAETGEPWRVFCASLADVFDNEVDPRWRADLFRLIHETPALTWMLLTKRIGNAARMIDEARSDAHLLTSGSTPWPWPNVWLGATVVNQEEADRDIPKLLEIPARIRWLSVEPQLGPVDLTALPFSDHRDGFSQNVLTGEATIPARGVNGHPDIVARSEPGLMPRIDWVITGGESGSHARPYVLGWAKDIVHQCQAAGVAVHVKQMGSNPTNREGEPHPQKHWKGADMAEWPAILRVQQFPV